MEIDDNSADKLRASIDSAQDENIQSLIQDLSVNQINAFLRSKKDDTTMLEYVIILIHVICIYNLYFVGIYNEIKRNCVSFANKVSTQIYSRR